MSDAVKKSAMAGKSGEHQEVRAFRAKLDSITETTLPLAKALNERIERVKKKAAPHDPRREPSERADGEDEEIPIDVIHPDDLDELD